METDEKIKKIRIKRKKEGKKITKLIKYNNQMIKDKSSALKDLLKAVKSSYSTKKKATNPKFEHKTSKIIQKKEKEIQKLKVKTLLRPKISLSSLSKSPQTKAKTPIKLDKNASFSSGNSSVLRTGYSFMRKVSRKRENSSMNSSLSKLNKTAKTEDKTKKLVLKSDKAKRIVRKIRFLNSEAKENDRMLRRIKNKSYMKEDKKSELAQFETKEYDFISNSKKMFYLKRRVDGKREVVKENLSMGDDIRSLNNEVVFRRRKMIDSRYTTEEEKGSDFSFRDKMVQKSKQIKREKTLLLKFRKNVMRKLKKKTRV